MIIPPAIPGCNCEPCPFHGEDSSWFDEECKDEVLQAYKERLDDPMSKIVFVERYVEVEMPEVEVLNVKAGDMICFKFDPDKCDIDIAWAYANTLKDSFPDYYDKIAIVLAPSLNPEIWDKEAAYKYIDSLKDEVDKWQDPKTK
jgi:hypothetical protein